MDDLREKIVRLVIDVAEANLRVDEATDAIRALMAERDSLEADLEAGAYRFGTTLATFEKRAEKAEAKLDAAVALLRVTRATVHETRIHLNNGPMGRAREAVYDSLGELRARIDALLADKEGPTDG